MKLTSHLYVVRFFFERNVTFPIWFFLAGNLLTLSSMLLPPYMLGDYSISKVFFWSGVCIAVIALTMFACMAVVLAFINPTSPKKKEMLVNEIKSLKKDIAFLQSEHWLEMVKESLGDKFDRITSQQYLLDERKALIHRRRCYIEAMEESLK